MFCEWADGHDDRLRVSLESRTSEDHRSRDPEGGGIRFRMERFAVSMAVLSEAYLFPCVHTKTTDGTCEGLQFVPLLLIQIEKLEDWRAADPKLAASDRYSLDQRPSASMLGSPISILQPA